MDHESAWFLFLGRPDSRRPRRDSGRRGAGVDRAEIKEGVRKSAPIDRSSVILARGSVTGTTRQVPRFARVDVGFCRARAVNLPNSARSALTLCYVASVVSSGQA